MSSPVAAQSASGVAGDPRDPQFPVLDALRAVGALAVLTTHTAFQAGDYARFGVWGTVLARLDVGVAIFFVLSGFLLSRPHLARAAAGLPAPATGRYYWKRVLRIWPAYVVAVVVALTFISDNRPLALQDWLTSLLMLDTYADDRLPHGLTQMWSLAVEVAFYLVLPLLMSASLGRVRALRPGRVWLTLGLLTGVSVVWHLWLVTLVEDWAPGMPATWLPAYLTWFAVGIGLAHVHVLLQQPGTSAARLPRSVAALGALPGTCWALVGGLMLIAATPLAGPALLQVGTRAESLSKHLLYAVIGGLVVLTGVVADRAGRYHWVMAQPFLRHLGHISYGVFCIHLVVLHTVVEVGDYPLFRGNGGSIWLFTLLGSLVAAELLYRLVEMPAMRFRDVAPRRRPDTATEPRSPTHDTTTR